MSLKYKGKTFGFFVTAKTADGPGLKTIEHIPEEFHKYLTIVSDKETIKRAKSRFPLLGDDHKAVSGKVDSAAKKRSLIMRKHLEDFVFMVNSDQSLHMHDRSVNKFVRANSDWELFKYHIKNLMNLCLSAEFGGVSLHGKPFSKQIIDAGASKIGYPGGYTKRTGILGSFFTVKPDVSRSAWFRPGRLDYYEDIDYTLQLLTRGVNTAQYVGIVYTLKSEKEVRKSPQRTTEVQDRDEKRILKLFPKYVTQKKINGHLGISVKWSKAYKDAKK